MSTERTTLEKIADSTEEAIADGLAELGLSENEVEIEVLDQGSKGLLGMGARQARVRLTVAAEEEEETTSDLKPERAARPAARQAAKEVDPDQLQNTISIAEETVRELLDKMHVTAEVSSRMGELAADEQHQNPPIVVEIEGDDLSYLIGKKAETLNALQYITRLIVGKEVGQATNIVVDVEGYRTRRERNLRQLAERMAKQALNTGSDQALEPMNPAERRIVHIALRDFDGVYTESAGDEPRRKVIIIPE